MKCVRLLQTGEIYRVEDLIAQIVVETGQAVYTTKDAWKRAGRKTTKNLNIEKEKKDD